jgi:hypothetical protein
VVSFQGKDRPSFSWHGIQTFKTITPWSHHIKVKGRTFQMSRQYARNDMLTHIKMLQRLVILLSHDNRLIQLEWTLGGWSQILYGQPHDVDLTLYHATTLVCRCQQSSQWCSIFILTHVIATLHIIDIESTQTLLGEEYRSPSSSLCSFLHSPVTLSLTVPKYPPQHPILKHPHPTFLPHCERPSFTPTSYNRQNYSSVYLNLCIFW